MTTHYSRDEQMLPLSNIERVISETWVNEANPEVMMRVYRDTVLGNIRDEADRLHEEPRQGPPQTAAHQCPECSLTHLPPDPKRMFSKGEMLNLIAYVKNVLPGAPTWERAFERLREELDKADPHTIPTESPKCPDCGDEWQHECGLAQPEPDQPCDKPKRTHFQLRCDCGRLQHTVAGCLDCNTVFQRLEDEPEPHTCRAMCACGKLTVVPPVEPDPKGVWVRVGDPVFPCGHRDEIKRQVIGLLRDGRMVYEWQSSTDSGLSIPVFPTQYCIEDGRPVLGVRQGEFSEAEMYEALRKLQTATMTGATRPHANIIREIREART